MIPLFRGHGISRLVFLCILCISLFSRNSIFAMEDLPEFESLTEEEVADFEGPDQIGSEYQSDIQSYMKPENWQYEWISSPKVLDVSIGSLSATQFLMDTRVKIHSKMNDHLEFRFTAFDDRDLEKQSRQQIFEFVGWPSDWWGLSLYGSPDFSKRKNDTGIALLLKPSYRHEIRIFNTFVDVTRLKRSDSPDNFLEPDLPYARGLVGRLWSDPAQRRQEFLQYALRLETKTRWLFPTEQFVHSYQKSSGSLFLSQLLHSRLRLNLRTQFDHKRESRTPSEPTSPVIAEDWTTKRWISHIRFTFHQTGPRSDWDLSTGMMVALRWWRIDSTHFYTRDFLPILSLSLPGFSSIRGEDRWNFGVMETLRNSSSGKATEFRFTLGYDFYFEKRSTLRLQANADLDEYGTPRSWEGGNAQLILRF
ncbi:MAG: hypothetical protein KGQ59_07150 [Bdellovibrionales bacterium]|nr:hypothetical protein [Bdellovibrionales bacterium]